jgi:2-amino-4-hydroxy-6-hydroxymethyldihydropteridine diphosphokinase
MHRRAIFDTHTIIGTLRKLGTSDLSATKMILIGLGANLPSSEYGSPKDTLEAALAMLAEADVTIERCSRWYTSPPVPPSDQPWYVNGVASIRTALPATALLDNLHRVERELGRTRRTRWEARIVDLDLLVYGDEVIRGEGVSLAVPHPRLHERLFVLQPLAEISSAWRHPVLGLTAVEMLAELPSDPRIRPIQEDSDLDGV